MIRFWFATDLTRKAFFAVTAGGGKRSVFTLTFLVKASIGWGCEMQECVRTISYIRRITPTPNQTYCHPIHLEGESKINGHYKALQLSDQGPLFFVCSANSCHGVWESDRLYWMFLSFCILFYFCMLCSLFLLFHELCSIIV